MATKINVGDEKGVARRDEILKLQQQNLDNALQKIMDTSTGRSWMWDFLSEAHVNGQIIFDTGDPIGDIMRTMRALGAQNLGKRVLGQITEVCPDLYIQMVRESKKKEAKS